MLTRRSILKGAAAVAGLAAMEASGLPNPARAGANRTVLAAGTSAGAAANVLLVHGAFADGSSWSRIIAILQERGLHVVAVQLPLTSLAADVAWTRHVLADRLQGPTVLVGQSYGGAVISGAASGVPNVVGLVFASAFAPDEGESVDALIARFAPAPGLSHFQVDSQGFLWIDPAAYPTNFAQDLDPEEAQLLAAVQKPIPAGLFAEPAGPPAWRTLPSWYLLSTLDRMLNPDLQRFMATRIGAKTVEVSSSHASEVSHPRELASLILAAAGVGAFA